MFTSQGRNVYDIKSVLRNIGYRREAQPSGRVVALLDDYLENAHNLIAPDYAYVVRDIIDVTGDRVNIEGGLSITSPNIARLLHHCRSVAIYAATISDYLEATADSLSEDGLLLQASVLDAIGSSAVERVAGLVEERIKILGRLRRLDASLRFSPGYCDWDISGQAGIFHALKDEDIDITLTDSFLMLPRKSTTGIVGLGNGSQVTDYNPCRTCQQPSCAGRRR